MTQQRVVQPVFDVAEDRKKLVEAFPEVVRGVMIKYDVVERLLGYSRRGNRYRWQRVTDHWRNHIFKTQTIVVGTQVNVGFLPLTYEEQLALPQAAMAAAAKSVIRASTRAGLIPTDELTEEQQLTQTATVSQSLATGASLQRTGMKLAAWLTQPPHAPRIEES